MMFSSSSFSFFWYCYSKINNLKKKWFMLFKKYQFPINIFIVFEKVNPIIYTSQVLTPNHYVCFINSKWYYGINLFLKKELFFNFSKLTDMSCIDTLKYNKFIPEFEFLNKK